MPKGAISQNQAPSQGQQDQQEGQGQPDQPSQQYQVPGQQPWVLIAQPNSGPAAAAEEQLDTERRQLSWEEQERLEQERLRLEEDR